MAATSREGEGGRLMSQAGQSERVSTLGLQHASPFRELSCTYYILVVFYVYFTFTPDQYNCTLL